MTAQFHSGLVHEHGRLDPYPLLSPKPMEADECIGDVGSSILYAYTASHKKRLDGFAAYAVPGTDRRIDGRTDGHGIVSIRLPHTR